MYGANFTRILGVYCIHNSPNSNSHQFLNKKIHIQAATDIDIVLDILYDNVQYN